MVIRNNVPRCLPWRMRIGLLVFAGLLVPLALSAGQQASREKDDVATELVIRVGPSVLRPSLDDLQDADAETRRKARHQLNFLERLELVKHVQRVVQAEFGASGQDIVGQGMSAATFARPSRHRLSRTSLCDPASSASSSATIRWCCRGSRSPARTPAGVAVMTTGS